MDWRIIVAGKYINLGYPKRFVLKRCKISKSSWYYNQKTREKRDTAIKKGRPIPGYSYNLLNQKIFDDQIIEILKGYRQQEFFDNGKGYKILHHYLLQEFRIIVNTKKIYRLCKQEGLLLQRNKKKIRSSKYQQKSSNWIITKSNQMWQFDIKYIHIAKENRFAYYLGFIDVLDREIVNYYFGLRCTAKHLKNTLEEALKIRDIGGESLIIRSDRGTQMTSLEFGRYIDTFDNLIHELIPPHTPDKNAYIESFNSILEIEALQRVSFNSFAEAYATINRFVKHYNNRRLHGSIKNLPPSEFRKKYMAGDFGTMEVHITG